MNLREFIDYKSHCPLCNEELTLLFHSNKKQAHVIEDNGFTFIFALKSLARKSKMCHVGYSFNYDSNKCFIEFYNKDFYIKDYIPLSLIDRFKEYDNNNFPYRMIKKCQSCHNYYYNSSDFILNDIIDFTVNTESFNLDKGAKRYKIINNYYDSKTILYILPCRDMLTFELIPFTTPAETFDRIEKLIIFS